MAKASEEKRRLVEAIWDRVKEEINASFKKSERPLTNREIFDLSREERCELIQEIRSERNEFWATPIHRFWDNHRYFGRSTYCNSPDWLNSLGYADRHGKFFAEDLTLEELFDNMQEMLSSKLTNNQLYLLGCVISIIPPLMQAARKEATAEVVADNEYQKEQRLKYERAMEEMYEKMPLGPGAPTSAGVAIANGEEKHLPEEDRMVLIRPALAADENGHTPYYTHGDYMLLHRHLVRYKELLMSAKNEILGSQNLTNSLQDYIEKLRQTNAEIEQQMAEINEFLNQPQRPEPAGMANAPSNNHDLAETNQTGD